MKTCISLLAVLLGGSFPGGAVEHRVSSAADITQVENDLKPGDQLVMTDGVWRDQTIVFRGQGGATSPIVLRAESPGKVILSGNSSVQIEGSFLVASGLSLKETKSPGDGIRIMGDHCQLTDSAVVAGAHKFFVHVFGTGNRVDHCYLAEKTTEQPTLQIEADGRPNHDRIDHNYFGPRPPLRRNGGETIRVGYSWQSMNSSATLVETNLFEQCDGEIEIISSKSCDNIYRGNTFSNCAGMLTLRHGNRCLIEGNFFLGQHKRGSGGIRVIGEDHTIINNYIAEVEQGAFWITAGIPDSPLVGYFRARNCLIAFNTVVDSHGPYLDLNAGFGTSRRSLMPENITIANNLLVVPPDGALLHGKDGAGFKWMNNLAWTQPETGGTNAPPNSAHEGIVVNDPRLARAQDGLWRPAVDSPVRGAAAGDFTAIKADVDGQPRAGRPDVGCDQLSESSVTSRPLTPKDVGPEWMKPGGH